MMLAVYLCFMSIMLSVVKDNQAGSIYQTIVINSFLVAFLLIKGCL